MFEQTEWQTGVLRETHTYGIVFNGAIRSAAAFNISEFGDGSMDTRGCVDIRVAPCQWNTANTEHETHNGAQYGNIVRWDIFEFGRWEHYIKDARVSFE